MYDPSTYGLSESSFAFFYNGSSQGPITVTTTIAITDNAHSTEWSTAGSPNYTLRPIGNNHFVGRADAIMTPTGGQYDTFGFLRAQGNIDRSYTYPFSAWQDHPARTNFHTSLTDEALHLYCDDMANLLFSRPSTLAPNFTIDVGRAVIGGFLV